MSTWWPQRSLVLRMLLAQAAVALAVCAAVLFTVYRQTQTRLDQNLGLFATLLGARVDPRLDEAAAIEAARMIEMSHTKQMSLDFSLDYRPEFIYQAFDPSGNLRYRAENTGALPLLELGPRARHPGGPPENQCGGWSFATIMLQGEYWRAARAQGGLCDEAQVAEPMSLRREATWIALKPHLARMSFILPLGLLIAWAITWYALAPLRRVTQAIAARPANAIDDMSAPQPAYAEVTPLVDEINRLLARLRRLMTRERESFADTAHELLTPIALIEAQANLLATADGPQARERAAADLRDSLMRTATVIRQLLLLARIGGNTSEIRLAPTDLAAALQEHVAVMATRALRRDIDITLESPDALACEVDLDILMSAVDNLLDNAIRHGRAAGVIVVSLVPGATEIELSVRDDGPGIAEQHLSKVTERFYRVPGTDEPGSGLGLAIVRCAIELHGGTLTLATGIGGRGLAAILRWPRR